MPRMETVAGRCRGGLRAFAAHDGVCLPPVSRVVKAKVRFFTLAWLSCFSGLVAPAAIIAGIGGPGIRRRLQNCGRSEAGFRSGGMGQARARTSDARQAARQRVFII